MTFGSKLLCQENRPYYVCYIAVCFKFIKVLAYFHSYFCLCVVIPSWYKHVISLKTSRVAQTINMNVVSVKIVGQIVC